MPEEFPAGFYPSEWVDEELERVKGMVNQVFPVDSGWREQSYLIYRVYIDDYTRINEDFDRLYSILYPKGYIPMLREDKRTGAYYVICAPHTKMIRKSKPWINIVLLIATLITTTLAGAMLWQNYLYLEGTKLSWISSTCIENGILFFALPLLAILGTHEMGHYIASKRCKLYATLPYFIPVPPIPGTIPIGTFGAFINLKEPLRNKDQLAIIGAAGPIAGFLVAIPVAILGIYFTYHFHVIIPPSMRSHSIVLVPPLFLMLLVRVLPFHISQYAAAHPTFFAGWIGIFLTGLNLMPIGQLDGGHVARALFGDKQRLVAILFVIFLALFIIFYPSWIFFLLIVFFLGGFTHPPPLNDLTKLGKKAKIVAIIAIILFILTFVPLPMVPAKALPFR